MTQALRVMVESGKKKVVAVAFDWIGWERSGTSEADALRVLADYRRRYDRVAELAGLAPDFHAAVEPEVVERIEGTSTTDFYGISTRSVSTEYEPMTEAEFVAVVTDGQPAAPPYFAFDATLNRKARAVLDEAAGVTLLTLDDVLARQAAGAVVLDARDAIAFAAGHLAESVNVGLEGRFAEYAGDVLHPDGLHICSIGMIPQ